MRNCFELLSDVVAIHLFKPGELIFNFPFNVVRNSVLSDTIVLSGNSSALSLSLLNKIRGIAVDTYYKDIPNESIEAERGIFIKETTKQTSSGVCFSTRISANTYESIDTVKRIASDFSICPFFDVVIVDDCGNVFVCRGSEPATSITVSANLPTSSKNGIEIEIVSVNGIIPVLFG